IICLLGLGYMISHFGGLGVKLHKQLGLLKEVGSLSNPRFGIDRTILSVMEGLRSSFDADCCLLIAPKGGNGDGWCELYQVHRGGLTAGPSPQQITEEMTRLFLSTSPVQGVIYDRKRGRAQLYDIKAHQPTPAAAVSNWRLNNIFDGKSYLSVPFQYHDQATGRLYIVGRRRKFDYSDIDFAVQLIEQVNPFLENIRLVDHLASDAAEQERQKIALDIHDSIIQPYIGLQFGLVAVRQQLENRSTEALKNVNELLDLTNSEIAELRRYLCGLRTSEPHQNILLPALRRFVSKFSAATRIDVEIKANSELSLNDRLAGELFQIVTEGLSN